MLAGLAHPVGKRREGWRPRVGIVVLDRAPGRENFPRLAAPEACGTERTHQLEIHFGACKPGDPGVGPFDVRHQHLSQ